ncbi:MAG: hypothetical protein RBR07_10465, partial [Arcobacteraceae bacterium]|nr:hypothetical protein [Arcobacteraceae bacterium]
MSLNLKLSFLILIISSIILLATGVGYYYNITSLFESNTKSTLTHDLKIIDKQFTNLKSQITDMANKISNLEEVKASLGI